MSTKKTFSKEQLEKKANKVFADYPNAKKVYATADGNCFLLENRANMHAGPKGTVLTFERPVKKEVEKPQEATGESKGTTPTKAVDVIAAITKAESLEALKEFESDKRATVVAAFRAKGDELTKNQTN